MLFRGFVVLCWGGAALVWLVAMHRWD
jgi:hypothetical protein